MASPGVSVALIRALAEEVVCAGTLVESFLAKAGCDPNLLADPNARVSTETYHRLQELALDLTGDPALGLHLGARAPLPAFDVVGSLSLHCVTLRQAFELFSRYRQLVSDCPPPTLVERGEHAALTYHFIHGNERCSRLSAELGIAALIRFGRMATLAKPRSAAIEFEHAAPGYADEYRRILGWPVRFGCASTRILFERRQLDQPLLHSDGDVRRVLESQADRKLADLSSPRSLSDRVRNVAADHYVGERPTMEQVARLLSLSTRSLRRRLHEEGSSFAALLEQAAAEAARRMLEDRGASIREIAYRLGFSEPSAFHRAFKRWTGSTPGQFRAASIARSS